MISSRRRRRFPLLSAACVAAACASSAFSAVNDVLPADYFPQAKGGGTLAIYAYDRQASGYYAQGQKEAEGKLSTQILALRAGRFFEIAGQPVSAIAVLPWAQAAIEPEALAATFGRRASGLGDLRLGASGWLLSDRHSGQYLGVTALVSLPTGSYERKQVLNIGENRHKATLSLGWIQPINDSLNLDLTPELAWFGTNPDYLNGNRLTQKLSYALTGYLRYRATPNWQFYVGKQLNYGGENRINGVEQHNAPDNPRAMLGATFLSNDRQHQWVIRLAQDTAIKNGFKTEAELLLRYLRMF